MDKKNIQQYHNSIKNLIIDNITDKEISDKICEYIDFLNSIANVEKYNINYESNVLKNIIHYDTKHNKWI